MAIIRDVSRIYKIIGGYHKGRPCSIRRGESDPEGSTTVVFLDVNRTDFARIKEELLQEQEVPGWEDDMPRSTYDLKTYLSRRKGDGSNMLLEKFVAQPRALNTGHVLATGERVLEPPRRGYNSSVLINLSETGWVELAARLPVALSTNEVYKLPGDLVIKDVLITGCAVLKNSERLGDDWVNVFLDKDHVCIDVPHCIPLALI